MRRWRRPAGVPYCRWRPLPSPAGTRPGLRPVGLRRPGLHSRILRPVKLSSGCDGSSRAPASYLCPRRALDLHGAVCGGPSPRRTGRRPRPDTLRIGFCPGPRPATPVLPSSRRYHTNSVLQASYRPVARPHHACGPGTSTRRVPGVGSRASSRTAEPGRASEPSPATRAGGAWRPSSFTRWRLIPSRTASSVLPTVPFPAFPLTCGNPFPPVPDSDRQLPHYPRMVTLAKGPVAPAGGQGNPREFFSVPRQSAARPGRAA